MELLLHVELSGISTFCLSSSSHTIIIEYDVVKIMQDECYPPPLPSLCISLRMVLVTCSCNTIVYLYVGHEIVDTVYRVSLATSVEYFPLGKMSAEQVFVCRPAQKYLYRNHTPSGLHEQNILQLYRIRSNEFAACDTRLLLRAREDRNAVWYLGYSH